VMRRARVQKLVVQPFRFGRRVCRTFELAPRNDLPVDAQPDFLSYWRTGHVADPESRQREREHRAVPAPLQRSPPAFEPRVLDAGGLQGETSYRRWEALLSSCGQLGGQAP